MLSHDEETITEYLYDVKNGKRSLTYGYLTRGNGVVFSYDRCVSCDNTDELGQSIREI